ncbi:MAG TPA: CARDB domain-containing protein [Dongiaceae bacterium]
MQRTWVRYLAASALTTSLTALSGAAFAAADLAPDVANLAANGHIGATNLGDAPSGPAVITIVCSKNGGGGCAEAPGLAAYANPAYPDAVTVNLPGLPPGGSFDHALAFWDELEWDPGSYTLSVLVDAGNAVDEDDEFNNDAAVRKTQLNSSVGTPVPKGPDTLTQKPVQKDSGVQAVGGVVAGLPDLIPTTLGFVMFSPIVPWGSSTTITDPNWASATQQGPQHDLCTFSPVAYRTFNKGAYAAGPFVTKVYRDNALVHTHNVPGGLAAKSGIDWHKFPIQLREGRNVIKVVFDADKQVSEGDEKNAYSIGVNVKIDCNGDGKAGIGGLKNPEKQPQPGSTLKLKLQPAKS